MGKRADAHLGTDPPPPARRAQHAVLAQGVHARPTSACAESTTANGVAHRHRPTHLRLRGEHRSATPSSTGTADPPPPARRARSRVSVFGNRTRPTSACAESTRCFRRRSAAPATHLRLRGEHALITLGVGGLIDPPPPARRAPEGREERAALPRPTSACAESTGRTGRASRAPATHLRLRGEHVVAKVSAPRSADPPPPARRAQACDDPRGDERRPTSACAESTGSCCSGSTSVPTHLRLRREHARRLAQDSVSADPPPPARRAHQLGHQLLDGERPTSACAESTACGRVGSQRAPTHLRLRGEHGSRFGDGYYYHDPPPPARRAHRSNRRDYPPRRPTSACAESTTWRPGSWRRRSTHLRLRGEHDAIIQAGIASYDPPPPARRAHHAAHLRRRHVRPTSACVESTEHFQR